MGIPHLSSTSLALTAALILAIAIFSQSVLASPQGSSEVTRGPYVKSPRDQPCSRNEECSALFPNSWCKNGRTCECQKDNVEYEGRCLPVVPINGDDITIPPCEVDLQCAADPNLSRCNRDTKKCECYDKHSNGRNATASWRNVCFIKTGLGQYCEITEACKASISPPEDVECETRTRTCKCKDGKTCEDLKGASPHVSPVPAITLILSGFMAFKVFH